jgi:hypothetical protein
MALFKHKLTGELIERPAHYSSHPVLGKNLVPADSTVAPVAKPSKAAPKKAVEAEPTPAPLTSAAEPEVESEIEVNIETDKE